MHDDDDELPNTEASDRVQNVNGALLEMIAEAVKLSIIISEMSFEEVAAIKSRFNAYVSAVNTVDIDDLLEKKTKTNLS